MTGEPSHACHRAEIRGRNGERAERWIRVTERIETARSK